MLLLAGLVVSAYGISAVLRLSAQESGQGADLILSGPVGRVRWALSQLLVALFGMGVLLVVGGAATGIGYGLGAGGAGPEAVRMLGAALAQLPAALLVTAVAVAVAPMLWLTARAVAVTAAGIAAFRRRDISD